jgi:hypothetical protein
MLMKSPDIIGEAGRPGWVGLGLPADTQSIAARETNAILVADLLDFIFAACYRLRPAYYKKDHQQAEPLVEQRGMGLCIYQGES